MSGAGIRLQAESLDALEKAIRGVLKADFADLFDALGTEIETQTRRRISIERKGPDGSAWAPWSKRYAKTRHGGNSLLRGEGHLLESITHNLLGDNAVEVGSNLVYAAVHQHGYKGIPARAYLGLTADNEDDLVGIVEDFLASRFKREDLS